MILATITHCRLMFPKVTDTEEEVKYKHLFVTYFYKEPLELILHSIENLKTLSHSKEVELLVCLEEGTPDKEDKIEAIRKDHSMHFKELHFSVHPKKVPGEIPGKCSNMNFGLRSMVKYLKANNQDFDPKDYLLTSFDIDTKFDKNYINVLVSQAKELEEAGTLYETIFQPVLYYNWCLENRIILTRITALLRNAMIMGALTPLNINHMSVCSISLELMIEGDFVHPFYQMDDIISYIKWQIKTEKSLNLVALLSPTVSGVPTGKNYCNEIDEWYVQAKRW
eukprot:CAMPEP_0170518586 /NCGR_PEP_ID=MMETSP0209-20121228/4243_1 /TAXON_ID=665100 ORGANISM="Litonotus pictus, Strain P1" /NCGR_SAMPLE_ID=MMETSP0209 /ASSEMBLY_ACC=CAM_ASM_000301 /LENGTH=280 /DNA_ID=CAMNT_0010804209 /DNA_START=248 /DNA_END=1087 /DNA_ORIENTATION=+